MKSPISNSNWQSFMWSNQCSELWRLMKSSTSRKFFDRYSKNSYTNHDVSHGGTIERIPNFHWSTSIFRQRNPLMSYFSFFHLAVKKGKHLFANIQSKNWNDKTQKTLHHKQGEGAPISTFDQRKNSRCVEICLFDYNRGTHLSLEGDFLFIFAPKLLT